MVQTISVWNIEQYLYSILVITGISFDFIELEVQVQLQVLSNSDLFFNYTRTKRSGLKMW